MLKNHTMRAFALNFTLFLLFSGSCAMNDTSEDTTLESQAVQPCGLDNDGDGFLTCASAPHPSDCDDTDSSVFPGQHELCNQVDDDCDGETDEYITHCEWSTLPGPDAASPIGDASPTNDDERDLPQPPAEPWPPDCVDQDHDGWPICITEDTLSPQDCDDEDPHISPSTYELCNQVDDDCDGETDEYITHCEWSSIPGDPPADPEDEDPPPVDETETDRPRRPTPPWPDGCVDEDRDGWPTCTDTGSLPTLDCDDHNPYVSPSAYELCNDLDDDCDGRNNEGIANCDL